MVSRWLLVVSCQLVVSRRLYVVKCGRGRQSILTWQGGWEWILLMKTRMMDREERTVAKEELGSVGGGERNPTLSDNFVAGGGLILTRTTTTRDDGDKG